MESGDGNVDGEDGHPKCLKMKDKMSVAGKILKYVVLDVKQVADWLSKVFSVSLCLVNGRRNWGRLNKWGAYYISNLILSK